MLRIYFYFLRRFLPYVVGITATEYAFLFVVDRMGFDTLVFQAMIGWVAPFAVGILGSTLLPSNLSWLTGLPVRKRAIIAANFLMNVTAQALALAGAAAVILAFNLTRRSLDQVRAVADAGFVELGRNHGFLGHGVYLWVALFVLFDAFLMVSLSFFRASSRGMQFSYQGWRTHRGRARAAAVTLGGILVFALLRPWFDNAFFYFAGAMGAFAALVPWSIGHAVGLGFPARRRMMQFAVGVVAVQVGALFFVARANIASKDLNRVATGVTFLGPYSGRITEADLGQLLASDIDAGEFAELAKRYRDRFNGGAALDASRSRLRAAQVALTKSRPDRIYALAELFDLRTIPADEIPLVLGRLTPAAGDEDAERFAESFLGTRFGTARLSAMLESRDILTGHLALLAARYEPDPSLADRIRAQLATYADPRKLDALLTLSVIEGRRAGIADFAELSAEKGAGRRLASTGAAAAGADCDSLRPASLAELERLDAGRLNACLRVRALAQGFRAGRLARIEARGWFANPLDPAQARILRAVFHVK